MKQGGRLGIERNVDLAKCLVTVEVGAYVLKRHGFLGVAEFDADKFLGLVQHVFRYAQRCGRWRGRRHWSRIRRWHLSERGRDIQMRCRQCGSAHSRNKLYEGATVYAPGS